MQVAISRKGNKCVAWKAEKVEGPFICPGCFGEVVLKKGKMTNEEKVLAYIQENSSISRSECQKLLDVTTIQARYILQKMRNKAC